MTDRRALRLALRRLDWNYQDRERGRTKRPRAYKYHAPRRVSPIEQHVEMSPRGSRQRRQPSEQVVRDALGTVALVGVATLLLYYIGTSAQ
jgi:hypothetical protein